MAEGGNVPELGGYDYEFTSKVPDYWECLVCQLTLKDPVQIVGCGHRLCNICMESLLRRPSPTCPADRQPLSHDKIFPDAACHRQILDLAVKCPHVGCSWTGELRAAEKHQSRCLFKVVKCPNSGCTEKLTRQDMHGHMTFECSWRKMNCEYCQESIIVGQKQKHFDGCKKFPVQCTNKCALRRIPREKLDVHIRDECPATEVQCEYKKLGCEEVFPRSNAKSHLESQCQHHLNLALRGLEATQLQVCALVNLVKDQSEKIDRLENRLTENYAPFVWKIPNYQAVYDRAVTGEQEVIISEPFYLSKNGYKLRMRMMPNGGSVSDPVAHAFYKGKFMSLYIVVVPGEYDAVLHWPFTENVRLTLIDQHPQQSKRKDITDVIPFKENETPRPYTEDVKNSYGDRDFVDLKTLQTRSYIKNDTIFIISSKE